LYTEDEKYMRLYAVETGVVKPGDSLVEVVLESLKNQQLNLEDDDVLALASKIVSYSQRRIVRLSDVKPSERARRLAKKYSLEPGFASLVVDEAEKIYGGVEKAVLTLKDSVLTANAGIDNKNAPVGYAVLWPENLAHWLKSFRDGIHRRSGKHVAVIVIDSGLIPLRVGTVGLALAVAGFNPIRDWRGKEDLYGKPIMITRHAVADDLASAAHLSMGEAAEKTPIVLIKDAPVDFDDDVHCSEEMMMPLRQCIFMNAFKNSEHST
jgi:coenzyme F420-0:L-glutamate ligase